MTTSRYSGRRDAARRDAALAPSASRGSDAIPARRPVDEAKRARLLNEAASLLNEALALRAAIDAAATDETTSVSLTDLRLLRDDLETLTAAIREAHRELAAIGDGGDA